ncbi:anthranilate synthase component I, partial [Salmonella enterica subsp. enterica serovar Heidelberg str. 92-0138]
MPPIGKTQRRLFHQVCGDRPATLLLESADIDSKDVFKKPAA